MRLQAKWKRVASETESVTHWDGAGKSCSHILSRKSLIAKRFDSGYFALSEGA